MRSYLCNVTVNNGRFDRSRTLRIEASSFGAAARKALKTIRTIAPPRSRIEKVSVSMTALKKVVDLMNLSDRTKSAGSGAWS